MRSNEIRQTFKDFFLSKQHRIVPSAPVVAKNDPTLMFTNAGMNQFKDIFLENCPIVYPRVVNTQKCLRVSGKHNDLEGVGHDTFHHTLFEMLGNWSFGDYFKKEAIAWAWEYLTDVLKISENRLYATVFEGNKDELLEADMESYNFWKQYLPEERILYGSKKDNFWEMGESGPCGPCSEIHVDIRDEEERKQIAGSSLINKDNPHVIEIWNLVFIQFNRLSNGKLMQLPKKHVDTGMGFERLCMVVQGKKSNYDTDIFQDIISQVSIMSGKKYGDNSKIDIAMRVVADHLRAISFSIADGQLPGNNKAGYVIRRILRRSVRYGYTFLGFDNPFIYKLVANLVQQLGETYPELCSQQQLIEKVIHEEELSFFRTLDTGIKRLESIIKQVKNSSKTSLSGSEAFELYDTYGFPFDLTELILKENGLQCDTCEFNCEMQKQKERARNAATVETDDWVIVYEGEQSFVGYDLTDCYTDILRCRKVKQKEKEFYQIVFSHTPFYAESGGQAGDTGWLVFDDTEKIEIINTKKENDLTLHYTNNLPKNVTKTFHAIVDFKSRKATESNHTATHLLHEALRNVLGNHVEQKGSLVTRDSLRFDFSHFAKVTDEELRSVEKIVNEKIRENISLEEHRNIPVCKAQDMGAIALFGEKYGDEVRVIKFGTSVELCGGTHAFATGNIGMFKIRAESSIAAGIRRIEAITGEKVEELINHHIDNIKQIRAMFNNAPNILQAIKKEIEQNTELKHQVDEFITIRIQQLKEQLQKDVKVVGDFNVYTLTGDFHNDIVKRIAAELRGELKGKSMFIAGIVEDGNPYLTLMLTNEAVASGLNASNIVREAAKLIQGGGGGQPNLATAGGKNPDGLHAAVKKVIELVVS